MTSPTPDNSALYQRNTVAPPEFWLMRLVSDLLLRQPELSKRGNYCEGRHMLPEGEKKYMKALDKLQKLAPTNYIGLVTQAPVQRMTVRGFRFGDGNQGNQGATASSGPPNKPGAPAPKAPPKPATPPKPTPGVAGEPFPSPQPGKPVGTPPAPTLDDDAKSIWVANDMDLQSATIHNLAAKYGLAYALVSPAGPDDDYPVITAEDPRTCIVYRDPMRPTRALAALRMWTDDIEGRVLAILYTPDTIFTYEGPETSFIQRMTIEQVVNTLTGESGGPGSFTLVGTFDNPIGEVPVVEFVWRPNSAMLPEAEAGRDVCVVQDRINATILDRIVISRTQAYKQRHVTGLTSGNKNKVDWDPGSDMVWVAESPDVKFGEFSTADIRQILEAIRDDVSDIAAITQTPAHYLMGKLANVSGETLAQAEAGLVKKTKLRMKSMGWSHERVLKLAFAYMNDPRATEVDAEVLWEDPEQNALVDLASAAAQLAAAGVPIQLIMEKLGFTSEQIQFAEQAQQAQQAQQMQQQLDMAKATAAFAPPGGGVGSGKTAAAAKKPSPNSSKKKPTASK